MRTRLAVFTVLVLAISVASFPAQAQRGQGGRGGAAATTPPPPVVDVRAQTVDILRKGVVKVVAQGGSQERAPAAGFIVRAEARAVFVVTASHVVEGAERIGVEFFDERRLYPARVLGMEGGDARGLAALIVENDVPASVVVLGLNRDADVQVDEAVRIIGFPSTVGVPWTVTNGNIVGRRGKDIVFAGAVEPGNSGGPLVKGDQIVGLVTQAQGQFGFASPSLIVQYALESWGVRFGVRLRSTPTVLHENELLPLFRERGFSHPSKIAYNSGVPEPPMESLFGRFTHAYEPRTLGDVRVVVDRATGLMWQQSRTFVKTTGNDAAAVTHATEQYLSTINSSRHAGFTNWRLPTIEELGSLIEPRATVRPRSRLAPDEPGTWRAFIDDAFDYYVECLSSDRVASSTNTAFLTVDFEDGALHAKRDDQFRVMTLCAVRSMTSQETRTVTTGPL